MHPQCGRSRVGHAARTQPGAQGPYEGVAAVDRFETAQRCIGVGAQHVRRHALEEQARARPGHHVDDTAAALLRDLRAPLGLPDADRALMRLHGPAEPDRPGRGCRGEPADGVWEIRGQDDHHGRTGGTYERLRHLVGEVLRLLDDDIGAWLDDRHPHPVGGHAARAEQLLRGGRRCRVRTTYCRSRSIDSNDVAKLAAAPCKASSSRP